MSTLELPTQDFSEMNDISKSQFTTLCQLCCRVLCKDLTNAAMTEILIEKFLGQMNIYQLKRITGQLLSFITEICRIDGRKDQIESMCEEYQLLKTEKQKILSTVILKYKLQIRNALSLTCVQISQLIGIDWRLCQDTKQKRINKINSPVFLIKLKFNVCVSIEFYVHFGFVFCVT